MDDGIAYPRHWRYAYAPELKDLYVRCTYKYKLPDQESLHAQYPAIPCLSRRVTLIRTIFLFPNLMG